jgi:valyl-tRNA synthetase
MRLGLCSRSADVLEPLLKPQWFVSLDQGMGGTADAAVRSGECVQGPLHRDPSHPTSRTGQDRTGQDAAEELLGPGHIQQLARVFRRQPAV